MIAADTNIFIHAIDTTSPLYDAAQSFMTAQAQNPDFVICELVLVELYMALRNPAIFTSPYSAADAVEMCNLYRSNDVWQCVDYHANVRHDLWRWAAKNGTAFRQIIDRRLALVLQYHGVTELATVNLRHFQDAGFKKVWNPLV